MTNPETGDTDESAAVRPADESVHEPANPPLLFDMRTQIGGPRGMFDSSFPGLVMTISTLFTSVWRSIIAALVAAALLATFRLIRREPAKQTAMSLGGIAFGYVLARSTGEAKTFFLPGIVLSGAYLLAFLISLAVRQPLMGFAAAMLDARYQHWQTHPPLRRAATRATVLWLGFFAVKFFVVGGLYLGNRTDWLPVTRLALGLPLYVVVIGITVVLLRPHQQVDTPTN